MARMFIYTEAQPANPTTTTQIHCGRQYDALLAGITSFTVGPKKQLRQIRRFGGILQPERLEDVPAHRLVESVCEPSSQLSECGIGFSALTDPWMCF